MREEWVVEGQIASLAVPRRELVRVTVRPSALLHQLHYPTIIIVSHR